VSTSDIVAIALIALGAFLLLVGAALAVIEVVARGERELALPEDGPAWDKILEAIAAVLKAFGGLRQSSAIMIVGVFSVIAGCYLAVDQPL
jgi:uncharacterized membrane protein HdeD (DUF308 family)